MSSPTEIVDKWCHDWYAFTQLNKGDPEDLVSMAKNRKNANRDLAEAMRIKRDTITDNMVKRDFISKCHREFLTRVLSDG